MYLPLQWFSLEQEERWSWKMFLMKMMKPPGDGRVVISPKNANAASCPWTVHFRIIIRQLRHAPFKELLPKVELFLE